MKINGEAFVIWGHPALVTRLGALRYQSSACRHLNSPSAGRPSSNRYLHLLDNISHLSSIADFWFLPPFAEVHCIKPIDSILASRSLTCRTKITVTMEPFSVETETAQFLMGLPMDELLDFAKTHYDHDDATSQTDTETLIYVSLLIFARTKSTEHLERAICYAEGWVAETPNGDRDRPRRDQILALATSMQYDQQDPKESLGLGEDGENENQPTSPPDPRDAVDGWFGARDVDSDSLRFAISRSQNMLLAEHMGAPARHGLMPLKAYSMLRGQLYQRTLDPHDLDQGVRFLRGLADATEDDIAKQAECFRQIAGVLYHRFKQPEMRTAEDTYQIIDSAELAEALDPTADDRVDQERSRWLSEISAVYCARFKSDRNETDIDSAISTMQLAENIAMLDANTQSSLRLRRAIYSGERFNIYMRKEDLDRAIEEAESALQLNPDQPQTVATLTLLSDWLETRYDNLGATEDLSRALEINELGCSVSSSRDEASRLRFYCESSRLLWKKCGAFPGPEDANKGIRLRRLILDNFPDHPKRFEHFMELGRWCNMRAGLTALAADLDAAVDAVEAAFDAYPLDEPAGPRIEILDKLFSVIAQRHRKTGGKGNLPQMLSRVDKRANDLEQWRCLSQEEQARLQYLRVKLTWGACMQDYGMESAAFETCKKAIDLVPADSPIRFDIWGTAVAILVRQFHSGTHSTQSLNQAIDLAKRTLDEMPEDYPQRFGFLADYGLAMRARFDWLLDIADLAKAIEVTEMAVSIARGQQLEGDAMALVFINLASNYCAMVVAVENSTHLAYQGIECLQEALKHDPHKFHHARILATFQNLYAGLFSRTGQKEHARLATDATENMLRAISPDSTHLGHALFEGGNAYSHIYHLTSDKSALDRAVELFEQGSGIEDSVPVARLRCAASAGRLLAEAGLWSRSCRVLKIATDQLLTVTLRSMSNQDKQRVVADVPDLASLYAAAVLNAGMGADEALQVLELGRGVIAGLLLEMRVDVSELREQNEPLADEFVALRDQLDSGGGWVAPSTSAAWDWNEGSRRRQELAQRFDTVLGKIRSLQKNKKFMAPGKADLVAASERGPIVVLNVNEFRCDAILIHQRRSHEPVWVKNLPLLTNADVKKNASHLRTRGITSEILSWLWETAAGPILDELGLTATLPTNGSEDIGDEWPHVWWVLTGAMSHLPIHAAGYHGTKCTVLDRVVSTYSSSLKALVHGRRREAHGGIIHTPGQSGKSSPFGGPTEHRALLVAMEQTPGLGPSSNLRCAPEEVAKIARLCSNMGLKPVEPLPRERKQILEQIANCKVFHFAGHGQTDRNEPERSCLLLEDWQSNPLTVADVRDSNLGKSSPFLAYLSACSTSVDAVGTLADEGIHLANAFQLAGFRHVVGTLWAVSDRHCVEVAEILYKTIQREGLNDSAVARGLHQAVRALRDLYIGMAGLVNQPQASKVGSGCEYQHAPALEIGTENRSPEDKTRLGAATDDAEREGRNGKLVGLEGLAYNEAHFGMEYWAPYIHVGI